ncbi:hypothetical protein HYPSUDRAFT_201783 [Hypholoma sublateritium FD-334 SS-4]|uniref:4'-phosphopantetheinyl transferase domain-containing protein n=1 Tax=Hypholoma sublateritium (strain FD-334 SS-4) TaxID=945553 RepID=A0A0D2MH65_HYPSF|nr:hypothetical protein HYPSUDRAFT_201783 [Hypholoma sublateritium FD-334 SS-4]
MTALELGAPIRGILAFTSTSTDKAGRSVPAPGRGALTVVCEVKSKHSLPILDVAYRSRQLSFRRTQISQWLLHEQNELQEEFAARKQAGETVDSEYVSSRIVNLEKVAIRQEKDALAMYADDIGILSIHGTSTGANEENETHIRNDISFITISRTPGNAHGQVAGLLQTVITGIIPGNRNSNNIDSHFQDRQYLMFPSKTIHTDGIRAGVMSSFGFGQVGGTALVVHPRYLFCALEPTYYEEYKKRNRVRGLQSYKAMSEMMIRNLLVKIKEHPRYQGDMEGKVLLNSMARASFDPKTGEYSFQVSEIFDANAFSETSSLGVGVDQELISSVPFHNPTFLARNFTDAEISYCRSQPSPPSSFAARWVGKEAVFKSLGVQSKGAAAAMKDIEILDDASGGPTVRLHGEAKTKASERGVPKVLISLSHSETVAIAFARAS